jgi:hypothetical protein
MGIYRSDIDRIARSRPQRQGFSTEEARWHSGHPCVMPLFPLCLTNFGIGWMSAALKRRTR